MSMIMKDHAHRYQDSVQYIININSLRSQFDKKIGRLNKLKKQNSSNKPEYYIHRIVRAREIKKLEDELFTGDKNANRISA